jgi:hypothetical protein
VLGRSREVARIDLGAQLVADELEEVGRAAAHLLRRVLGRRMVVFRLERVEALEQPIATTMASTPCCWAI